MGAEQEIMSRRSFGHIRRLPSSMYQASLVSPSGGRINAPYTFLTRGDANAWLSAQQVLISSGKWQSPSESPSQGDIPEEFVRNLERHISLQTNSDGSLLRESTKALYRRLLRVNLARFHGRQVESITAAEVSQWWAAAISTGKKTSTAKAYKLLSAAMKRALREGLIVTSPCQVKGAHGASTGKKINVPTLEEVKKIAQHINPRYSKMVLLMAFGGFRFSEITELRKGDVCRGVVNKKETYIFKVERAVTLVASDSGKSCHKVDEPKSKAGIRSVAVSSRLIGMIESLLIEAGPSENSLLFPSASDPNRHLRHDVFMNSWRPALKRAGIPAGKYAPHCLRHFAGSHLHLAGANIPELKEWLGDASTAAVMRYIHPTGRTAVLADAMLDEEITWRAA